ncbi:MAG: hypothetical protein R2788_24780 [Saprospiraceae bacterium]
MEKHPSNGLTTSGLSAMPIRVAHGGGSVARSGDDGKGRQD